MKEGIVAPRRLVNLRTVRGLDASRRTARRRRPALRPAGARWRRSPRTRWCAAASARSPTLPRHAATPQIRNVATLGGNLLQRPRCWYFRSEAFPCRRKGGTTASPSTARTRTTPSSATARAPSSTPRRRPPRWSRSARASPSPATRASARRSSSPSSCGRSRT